MESKDTMSNNDAQDWINNDKSKRDIINRIKTIKGHLAGIENMIEDGKPCDDILLQITAVKSSVHKVGIKILEEYAIKCIMPEEDMPVDKEKIQDVLKSIMEYAK